MPLSQFSSFYNSLAGFLLGAPSQVGVVNSLVPPSIRQSQYSIWVVDKIHPLPRLTVDLGVRYDVFSPLEPRNTGGAQYYDPTSNTFNYARVGSTSFSSSVYQLRNVAPRVGIAYSLNDKTVIRGGYGIQYFQMPYTFSGLQAPMTGAVNGVQDTYSVVPFPTAFNATVPGAPITTIKTATRPEVSRYPWYRAIFRLLTCRPSPCKCSVISITARSSQSVMWERRTGICPASSNSTRHCQGRARRDYHSRRSAKPAACWASIMA